MSRDIAKHEPQMVRYEAACRALAEAKAVDEVQELRSKADAMRVYAMQAKNKRLEVDAAEIRIRAERRLGELLAQQKAGEGLNSGAAGMSGNQHSGKVVRSSVTTAPTLADAGISKDLSARAQKLAAVPADVFEAEVGDWRDRVAAENARVVTRLETAGDRAAAKAAKGGPTPESLLADNARLRDELATEIESHEETKQNALELRDLLESYSTLEASAHDAAKELAREKGIRRTVEIQRDQWMTTCNELKREVKSRERQVAALERKIKEAA